MDSLGTVSFRELKRLRMMAKKCAFDELAVAGNYCEYNDVTVQTNSSNDDYDKLAMQPVKEPIVVKAEPIPIEPPSPKVVNNYSAKTSQQNQLKQSYSSNVQLRGGRKALTNSAPATSRSIDTKSIKTTKCAERQDVKRFAGSSNKKHSNKQNNAAKRNFNTYGATTKSFITKGPQARQQNNSQNFVYDLSASEQRAFGQSKVPMKTVPSAERKLINDGFRKVYLEVRNVHEPPKKYNFPEATSWRIGWFANKPDSNSTTNPTPLCIT